MNSLREESALLGKRLGLEYEPVGVMFAGRKPEGALGFRRNGSGCIAPLVFSAAKGKTVAFDSESTGYPCSAFYLGYQESIFPGVERYLSTGPLPGRDCERFVRTPELAGEFIASMKAPAPRTGVVIFKPVAAFNEDEAPEIVLLFADSDRMSALVYLAHHGCPLSQDRIATGFSSACGSLFTIPLQYASAGRRKAFWGLHDIAARSAFPREITSLGVPLEMFREMCAAAGESFLTTANWKKLRERSVAKTRRKHNPLQGSGSSAQGTS